MESKSDFFLGGVYMIILRTRFNHLFKVSWTFDDIEGKALWLS